MFKGFTVSDVSPAMYTELLVRVVFYLLLICFLDHRLILHSLSFFIRAESPASRSDLPRLAETGGSDVAALGLGSAGPAVSAVGWRVSSSAQWRGELAAWGEVGYELLTLLRLCWRRSHRE